MLVITEARDTANRDHGDATTDNGDGASRACNIHMPWGNQIYYWDFGDTSGANRLTWSPGAVPKADGVWVCTAGDHGSEIWLDGERKANQTAAVSRAVDTSGVYRVTSDAYAVDFATDNMNYPLYAM